MHHWFGSLLAEEKAMAEIQYYALLFFMWLFTTILTLVFFKKHTQRTSPMHLPPSPPGLPILGHLHLLKPPTHQSLQKLAHRYGPLLHLQLGYARTILVSNSVMAREVFKTFDHIFVSRPQFAITRRSSYGYSGFAFALYGPFWRFMRKLTVTELLGSRQLDRLLGVRQEEIRSFLQLLFKNADARKSVDMEVELTSLTNNIVCRMMMSTRCSGGSNEADECRRLVKEIGGLGGKFDLADYIRIFKNFDSWNAKKVRKLLGEFDEFVERILNEHEEKRKMGGGGENSNRDLLDIMLETHHEAKGDVKLTRENIKAFLLDTFIAGTDTSSTAMQWGLAELINHPDVFKKARAEIDSVVGKSRLVEESDVPKLPYVQAIVKETLRLHPTAPLILKENIEDCVIAGFDIPKDSRIFINAYAIGRDPEAWEDPNEFRPERFLVSGENGQNPVDIRGQHFQVVPFGSGRRGCPGASLALHVMHCTIASMIQCFDWKVEGDKVNMEEGEGFTLLMAQSLNCVPVSRFNPFTTSHSS